MRSLARLTTSLVFAGLNWACADAALSTPLAPAPSPVLTSSQAPVLPPQSPPASQSWFSCNRPGDTGESVGGFVAEKTADGSHAIGGATIELFHGGAGSVDDALRRGLVNAAVTRSDGYYSMCLPLTDGPSGTTGPEGEIFVVRVRKDGYRDTSHALRIAYGSWDYDTTRVDLDLVRH